MIQQMVRQAEAAVVAAQAQEANIRLEYERSERLYKQNAMSLQQLDAVKTQFEAVKSQREQAEAGLESARSQLTDALISAPIAGVVARRSYEAGDMASPMQSLVTVVQMRRVRVRIQVAETDLGKIKLGQQAQVRVRSYPDRLFEGKVDKVSPVLDRLARMAEVEVLVENRDGALRPGMFGRVEVKTGTVADVIVVPRYATIEVTSLQEGTREAVMKNFYVYVAKDDKAEQRKLEVRYANHEYIAVSSGLAEGEKLVTVGQNNLRDGIPIAIVNEEAGR
jgi:membrane fusion protein (multidrug efflux system)